MTHADEVLGDEEIVAAVYEALAKRHPKSRSRGRPAAPAEIVLRLLVLKHVRNWSYQVLEEGPRYHQGSEFIDVSRIDCDRNFLAKVLFIARAIEKVIALREKPAHNTAGL